ncbi:hypothetical protein LX15_005379 [Streptoalloteichus tenebrarius]|uniref:Uncharacterized protein n=1 Tax=Streptoalloteichus tenebrarius (strain ATCC 17920 / DSM 40477 / JCM 4838 / CBS 697.72 / NBRC 16177 / NCIMB 11028 / NRRL B-12390 / A12253. 1 / ISP 5477) TaxID=1933 RepID=A0ABT1I1P4_STRSD|nr:hypothetical protein [Streptoalloteichus tenebrarius]
MYSFHARLDPSGPTTLSQHLGRLDDLITTPTSDRVAALTGTRYRPGTFTSGRRPGRCERSPIPARN